MDLLQDNKKKNEKTPAQKVVLSLLIISIILCIIVVMLMAYLSMKGESKPYSMQINGKNVDLSKLQLITNENGRIYISLKSISNYLEYSYYNGEFKVAEENKNKGYIDNHTNIIQFFSDKKEIYKTSEKSKTDYEYYKLDNIIKMYEDNLYIDILDLDIALNLIVSHSNENHQTTIQTPKYWLEQRSKKFSENNITISNTPENIKALSHGYAIISKDGKYGVISLNGEEIIGNKYNSISFLEYTRDFIVANTNNKYGIISKDGMAKINLQYDSIEVLNYEPVLYKVKKLDKYGIMREDGSIVNEIKYDSIGYPENKAKEINYTLIIPNINEKIPESIVVCINGKYGLVDLETGNEILTCDLDGIYSATEDGKDYYIVETQNKKVFLENFIDNINRTIIKN